MTLTNSRTAKLAAGLVGIAMLATAVMPSLASADQASDLQAQINSLMSTIASLQSQLSGTTSGNPSTGYTFNTNLTLGSKGADVMNLQKVLNMSSDTKVASSGAGSPGMETTTFGQLTKAAVMKFQTKYGISPVAGYVGLLTRGKLNSMAIVVAPPVTPGTPVTPGLPSGGALSVYAGTQPANSLAPAGSSRVPYTNVTVSAGSNDVTINSITVERVGFAQDAALSGVVLLDASTGLQIGIAKTLNSNHQAMVGEPFVVKAGTSKMLTIAGNMASSLSSYTGQVMALNVVAVNTSASVTGSLPIMGAQQTLNGNLTIGSASVNTSSFDPNNGASQPIGTTGYRFSGLRLTAGSAEDLTLKSIRWNQSGSVGASDLANVVTVVNGTSYPTTVSTDGKYFTSVFPGGIVISKGNSVDAYVQGDLVGSSASGRTVEFDIYKNTDVYLTGNTYGYGVTAPTGSGSVSSTANHATTINTSSNPWFQGSQMSVTAGSVTLIGKANEVTSANIAANVSNQVLGGFATNFDGEPVSVQSMYFAISTTSGSLPTTARSPYSAITNVSIVDSNGAVVAGPIDAALADGSTAYGNVISAATSYAILHFTDTVTFPVGRKVYTIKGKIPSAWANGTVVTLYTEPADDWTNVTGQTTGNSVTIGTTVFNTNTMTVKGASVAINVSAQPAAQSIVGGTQGLTLANFQLDATNSGEDVRLSSFPVTMTATGAAGDLTGCQLWDGSMALNTGSGVINTWTSATAKTYSFDNSLVVAKGTSKTLALKCNLASSPTAGSFTVNADSTTTNYSVTGQTSGNSVTPTFGSGSGGAMTVASGSISGSVDSSSPSYLVSAGGTSGVVMGVAKFRATNEDVTLNKIGVIMTSGTASNVGTIYFYGPTGTQLGTIVLPQGSNVTATSTLTTPLNLPRDTDVLVTIKADLATIGTGLSGVEGGLIKIDPLNAEGTGVSSGSTLQMGSITAAVSGVRAFKSFPVIANDSSTLTNSGVADGKLMRFKVTADSHGPVGLYTFTFNIATTVASVTNVELYAFTDSGYSSAATTVLGSGLFDATNCASNGSLLASAPTLVCASDTTALQVPAGQTRYFELRATVAGVTSAAAITTTLNGDAAYIVAANLGSYSVSTTTGAEADANNDFIWSGNATTSAVFTANDWGNGFGVLGLPSGGFSFTRGF